MAHCYDRFDVHFEYPSGWLVEEDETREFVCVSVQSPATAFLTLIIYSCPGEHDTVMQEALDAMRDEFSDMDQKRAWQTLGGHRATGHDLSFCSLDLINTCAIRSFSTSDRTFLLMYQATDGDLGEAQPEFDRICQSLRVER